MSLALSETPKTGFGASQTRLGCLNPVQFSGKRSSLALHLIHRQRTGNVCGGWGGVSLAGLLVPLNIMLFIFSEKDTMKVSKSLDQDQARHIDLVGSNSFWLELFAKVINR